MRLSGWRAPTAKSLERWRVGANLFVVGVLQRTSVVFCARPTAHYVAFLQSVQSITRFVVSCSRFVLLDLHAAVFYSFVRVSFLVEFGRVRLLQYTELISSSGDT
jgi:hypothetical protein